MFQDLERLNLTFEVIGVKDHLALTDLHLLSDAHESLIMLQVFRTVVDHESLVCHHI